MLPWLWWKYLHLKCPQVQPLSLCLMEVRTVRTQLTLFLHVPPSQPSRELRTNEANDRRSKEWVGETQMRGLGRGGWAVQVLRTSMVIWVGFRLLHNKEITGLTVSQSKREWRLPCARICKVTWEGKGHRGGPTGWDPRPPAEQLQAIRDVPPSPLARLRGFWVTNYTSSLNAEHDK